PLVFEIKLIGTEADGAFLWGWANPAGYPPEITVDLRDHDIPELNAPETPVGEYSWLHFALVVAGIANLSAVYAPVAGEARVLLPLDAPALALPPFAVPRLITTLTTLMQTGAVRDWPAAVAAYGEQRGVDVDSVLDLELDDFGRVQRLSARSS